MEFFHGLLNGFKEYIYEKSIIESHDGEIMIVYTPFSYDLIDADLDFDEAYYSNHLLPNFRKLLDTEIINFLKMSKLTSFNINLVTYFKLLNALN